MKTSSGLHAPESPSVRAGAARDAESPSAAFAEAVEPLVAALRYELKHGAKDSARVARLNFELGRLLEWPLNSASEAASHYQKALGAERTHTPSMYGALRTLVAAGKHRAALSVWDALSQQAASNHDKALILLEKARFVEDTLGDERGARAVYYSAASLVEDEPAVLSTLERSELKAQHWNALEKVYAAFIKSAEDKELRAARVLQHARLLEVHKGDVTAAIERFEEALHLGGHASGPARAALIRLYTGEKRWADLATVLEMEADATRDTTKRAMIHYQIGRTQAERLGDREEAIAALARASVESEDDPVVLTYLARLLEAEGRAEALTPVLRRLVAQKDNKTERQALLHRIGTLVEQTGSEQEAIEEHREALKLDPTFVPILRALGRLYTKHERWEDLMAMHLGEAKATESHRRKAGAHMRVAQIQEVRLKDHKLAIEHHEKALTFVPTFEASFHALSRLYTAIGDFNKLAELYEHIIAHTEDDNRELLVERLMKLGSIYDDYAYGPAKAIEIYRRVLKLEPQHLGAIHALQRSAELGERYDILVEALLGEVDMTQDEERIVALVARAGDIRDRRLGDTEGALELFNRVLELRPKHRVALASLGRHHHRASRWEELLAVYERELDAIGSDSPAAVALMHKMGDLCERQLRRPEDALEWYRKATEADPTYSPAVDALERRLREGQRYAELVTLLERRRDHQSGAEKATTCLELGLVYEEHLDQADAAITSYKDALEAVPGHAVATEALRRMNARVGKWDEVVSEIEGLAAAAQDPQDQITAWLTAAEVCRDNLDDGARAVTFYEHVLEREPAHPGALVALESQTRVAGQWEQLAEVLKQQSESFSDERARLAALRELGRLYEKRLEDADLAQLTYETILTHHADDTRALAALERLAYAQGDQELLVQVLNGHLRTAEAPDEVVALRTRLGEVLEALDDHDALTHYLEAVATGVASLTAVRGLVRTAERAGDLEALAEGLRKEAELTSYADNAAACLVRAASVADEQLGDTEAASEDLVAALELAPASVDAAKAVSTLLRREDEHARLVELLEAAANKAKKGDQVAELRLEASILRADVLDDLGTAIKHLAASAKKAPHHVESHRTLAQLYARAEEWKKAEKSWDQVLMASRDDDVKRQARLSLADILDAHLDDRLKAAMHLRTLLKTFPKDTEALGKLVELMVRGKAFKDALPVAKDLVEATKEDAAKAEAYTTLGNVNLELKREEDAVLAFEQAIALEGPNAEAGAKYREQLPRFGTWGYYAKATRKYVETAEGLDPVERESVWSELVRAYEEELSQPREASEAAGKGLEQLPESEALRLALGRTQRLAGKARESIGTLTQLVALLPGSADGWRELAEAYDAQGSGPEAALAQEALALLEGGAAPARKRFTGVGAPASMTAEVVDRFEVDKASAAAELVAAATLGLAKTHPFDASNYGVTSRDRLTNKKQGLRKMAEGLLGLFGVKKMGDLYLAGNTLPAVANEVGDRPLLVAPGWLESQGDAEQVFALAQPLATFVRGLNAVDALSPKALDQSLRALAGTGDRDLGTKITKGCPRGIRKQLPELADAYVGAGEVEVRTWREEVKRTARRVAALVADDLGAAMAMLRKEKGVSDTTTMAEWVADDPDAGDLMAFWGSKAAMMWRQNAKQL